MDLEQIVRETVAKVVAEKKGKDLTGDGKIDSADYLKARDIAIKKAQGKEMDEARFEKGEDVGGKGFEFKKIAKQAAKQYGSKEAGQRVAGAIMKKVLAKEGDHEVSMAQNSLDSIIRSAMELKAKIGDQEINIPAWIQDHITNSENYIDQASQGYHEYENGSHEEMNEEESERSQKATKALDASLLKFLKNVYKDTPSDKIPEKYRNIINQNESQELGEGIDSKKSAVESASGDKISNIGYDDMDLPIFFSATDDTISYHLGYGGEFEGKIYKYDGKTGKSIEIGDLKHYGDGQNHSADDDMHESQQELDEDKMDKEELKQAQIEKAYDQLEKMKANTRLFSKDDIKKAEARIEKLEAELDALAEKSVNEAFDDFTVRRWQHYAGIK